MIFLFDNKKAAEILPLFLCVVEQEPIQAEMFPLCSGVD
jgi:hypothetical protein